MNPAPNLVLVGPMGAGKSSIGRRLAGRFGLAFVDLDREVEQRTGATIPTIFECEGEAGFRLREREVLADLLAGEGLLLASGGGAVLDPDNRRALVERFETSQSVYRRDPWADLSTPAETPKWAPLADLTLEAAE